MPLEALHERIAERGPQAHLVTVGAGGAPHVVSVLVETDGDRLLAGAGRTTSANVAARPTVTLVWAAPPGAAYSLIVDGDAALVDGEPAPTLAIRPSAAVLHRVAGAEGEGPSCIPVLPRP